MKTENMDIDIDIDIELGLGLGLTRPDRLEDMPRGDHAFFKTHSKHIQNTFWQKLREYFRDAFSSASIFFGK